MARVTEDICVSVNTTLNNITQQHPAGTRTVCGSTIRLLQEVIAYLRYIALSLSNIAFSP